MVFSGAVFGKRAFDPHETTRSQSLEGVALASFGRRAAAFVVDLLIVLAVFIPAKVLCEYLALRASRHPVNIAVNFRLQDLEDLIWMVVYSGVSLWWTNGLTIGKRLMRIRVVSLKKPKITLWQGIERTLGYGASSLEAGFGFIQYFIHHNRQCVHDRIAETIVVTDQPAENQLGR